MTDLAYPLRTAVADDFEALGRCFGAAMMFEFTPDETGRALFEPDRALLVSDGDDVVGTTRALTRDLSVPGAVVAAAHVTGVGVSATHRRRGILSALMARQLREVPEAIAVLWASEAGIYGRFGYAPAATMTTYDVDLARVRPRQRPDDPGRLRDLPAEGAGGRLGPMLAGLQRHRPGVSGRSEQEWVKRLGDPPEQRGGRTARRILVHEDGSGTVDGYALWRGKLDFGSGGLSSEVSVEELVAVDPVAYRVLWHHLLTMDLAGRLQFEFAAPDEPVQQLVTNPGALGRRVSESLWVRVTDVARALGQRRYATAVDVVLEIADELLPGNAGRFRLVGDHDGARCERTDAPADLALTVTELAAVYLGGRSLAELAATGRVAELRPGALATVATAFGWPVAPTSIEIF